MGAEHCIAGAMRRRCRTKRNLVGTVFARRRKSERHVWYRHDNPTRERHVAYDGGAVEAQERRLLGGRFEVLETLGRGGMGVVYRALDRERGVDVALKTLRGVTPESVLRFKTEFRALRDLRHPNLVELGELFENEGTWFFTMELVRGVPFLQWVRGTSTIADTVSHSITSTGGPLPVTPDDETSVDAPASVVARNAAARARRVTRPPAPCCDVPRLRPALVGLARGLAALHAAGIVHRDVKPSNILVDENGRVVLLDFGVVAELKRHADHEKSMRMGTVRYMAPEQARGEMVGPPADWYAMGVLLFQALAGVLPYGSVSHEEVVVLKQHVDAPLASELVDNVPPDLDTLAQALLDREPSKRPSELEIFEALGLAGEDEPSLPLPAHDQLFVGRANELAKLEDALDASRKKLTTTIVEGESGIGKTALVARFTERGRVRDRRLVVLYGRCHERERVPFNALDGVIDDLTRFLLTQREARLERLMPDDVASLLTVFPALCAVQVFADAAVVAGTVAAGEARVRAFTALRELLVRLCRRRAAVVVIDDVQWADPDSCALLAELVRTASEPLRLCLVATKSPGEGDEIVQLLGAQSTLRLGGLDARDAAELVGQVGPIESAQATRIVSETRGHPLFLRELARQPVTMHLEEAIWTRACTLTQSAQNLLAAVAVAGSPIPRHIAVTAAGLTPVEGDAHIAALVNEGFIRAHGPLAVDTIEPFHDRIRTAIYARQSEERRRELHHALALALETTGAPAAQLLSRFEAAGDAQRVAHYLVVAAETAFTAFAFGRAAELFRRALEAEAIGTTRRAWLMVRLAEALAKDGRTAEAARCFLEASGLQEPDSDHQLDLLRRAAERFLMAGQLAEGLETTRSVLERAGMALPTSRTGTIGRIAWNQVRMRGHALRWKGAKSDARSLEADICWSIGAGLGMVDSLLGAYFSERGARLALERGNALQICRGMGAATIGACLLGRRARAERLLAVCERAATEDGTRLSQWYLGLGRTGMAFLLHNDFARAHHAARQLENEWYSAGHGPSWETDVAMHFSLASQQMLGEFRELSRRVDMLAHSAKRNGDLFQEVTLRVRFAVRHLLVGRPAAAREDVRDALAAWLPGTDSFGNQRAWGLWSLTRAALYEGKVDTELDDEWERWQRSLIGRVPVMQTEAYHLFGTYLLARAHDAQKRGRPSEHAAFCRAADRLAERLDRLPFPAARGSAGMLRAAIVWARGGDRADAARKGLDAGLEYGVMGYTAFFKRRLGEAMGGDDGATLIKQADELALRTGWTEPERAAELAIPTGRFS
jgi:serine/threonine protein kinase